MYTGCPCEGMWLIEYKDLCVLILQLGHSSFMGLTSGPRESQTVIAIVCVCWYQLLKVVLLTGT